MIVARRLLLLAIFVGLLVGGWKFAHANAGEVRFDYLLGQLEAVRVWELSVACFLLGALVAAVVCAIEMARLRMLSRQYRRELGRLEAELHGLRALPLGPAPREAGDRSQSAPGSAFAGRAERGS